MNVSKIFFPLFCLIVLLSLVYCQICVKRHVFTVQNVEYRPYTYLSKIPCVWPNTDSRCWKTKLEKARESIIVTKRIIQNVQYCCDGFVRKDSGDDNGSIKCQPSCVPSCVNGHCERPGVCNCNEGYIKDPTSEVQCIPTCTNGCKNGYCTQPNVCECKPGYNNSNGTCSPNCTEPCHNGICVAPDICACINGYRLSERNTCEPYCFNGCDHGTCVGPDVCSCDEGWVLKESKRCEPRCHPPCINASCVAPNVCTCNSGYVRNRDICEPYCKNCDGFCIGPYTCICDPPFIAKNVTPDLRNCNCFNSCTDLDEVCDGTICVKPTTTTVGDIQTIAIDPTTECRDEDTEKLTYFEISESTESYLNIETEDSNVNSHIGARESARFQMSWLYVTLLIFLLLLLIVLVTLIVMKWKYLLTYFIGSSYIIEDTRNDYHSSQMVNVPLTSVPSCKNV